MFKDLGSGYYGSLGCFRDRGLRLRDSDYMLQGLNPEA